MKTDIIIGVVPVAKVCPQTGPSLIKSYLETKGYLCKVVDWNVEVYNSLTTDEWEKIKVPKDFDVEYITDKYPELFEKWVSDIKRINPEWLGVSAFSNRFTYSFTTFLCKLFKREIPHIKIILGGHSTRHLPKQHLNLLEKGDVDKIVIGTGELATEKILKGCEDKIIIGEDLQDLTVMPSPDYYDLDINKYQESYFLVIGSRGCINSCKFCQRFSSTFKSRGGENIAEEILQHYIAFGVRDFYISDACSNGDMKQFKILINKILEYNKLEILPKIKWRTQMSCRSAKIMDSDVWRSMKESGFHVLAFGLETGSERLRYDMGKRVKNEDVEFLFNQCAKNEIYLSVSMIHGYLTETEEDFQETMDFLKKWASEKKIIKEVFFGGFLHVEKGSYLYENREKLGITYDEYNNWVYKDNNFPFRYNRWLVLKEFLEKNKINYTQRLEKLYKMEIKKYE